MNISYLWLRALAPSITASPRELSDALGLLGAPVDELVDLGAELGDVLIARVESVRPHPNADRLRVCTVNAGGEALQVVCGAPNVEAGRYYPFAPVGALLPGGAKIGKAKLRGETSEGMLCSSRELGLGRDHAGLMTLAGEWEPGASFVEALGLDDARLVVDVTANRPDLLSHLGVAREVAPGGVDDLVLEPFSPEEPPLPLRSVEGSGAAAGVRVAIDDPQACPRYLAAVVRGVKVAPSPEWLASRLRAVGLRPINNVVDATNYVLHELGQPLHAFDLARLAGPEIRVRRAAAGESIRTLDGVDRALDPEVLVIADAERPVAIAGVMGGAESEVTDGTTDLLLECALFEPLRVRRAARSFGLSTDASYRFERGVDPELQPRALWRVLDLIVATAGGVAEVEALDVCPAPFTRPIVELRTARASSLLGVEITAAEIESLLTPIGFGVASSGDVLRVEVPGFRPDVTREVDLIEEIARRRGYDSFPEELRPFRPSSVPEDPMAAVVRRVHEIFQRWGFLEARTAGFAPESPDRVPLLNPLSAEESHLRDSLTPGLLRRVEHNWAHGVRHLRLYEVGTVFFPSGADRPREEVRLSAAFTGARQPPHWSDETHDWDVWDVKALLVEVSEALGYGVVLPGAPAASALEPGASFGVAAARGGAAAWGGQVTSAALDAPAWAGAVFALEAVVPESAPRRVIEYTPIPEFPGVERDLALIVPLRVSAAEVGEAIRAAAGDLLQDVWPFDQYTGKGVAEDARSLAWRLQFRHPTQTLTDAEVDRAVDAVLASLQERYDVHRR
jgi:phenylalanyl-tRNA synthetase beta chain